MTSAFNRDAVAHIQENMGNVQILLKREQHMKDFEAQNLKILRRNESMRANTILQAAQSATTCPSPGPVPPSPSLPGPSAPTPVNPDPFGPDPSTPGPSVPLLGRHPAPACTLPLPGTMGHMPQAVPQLPANAQLGMMVPPFMPQASADQLAGYQQVIPASSHPGSMGPPLLPLGTAGQSALPQQGLLGPSLLDIPMQAPLKALCLQPRHCRSNCPMLLHPAIRQDCSLPKRVPQTSRECVHFAATMAKRSAAPLITRQKLVPT